MEGRKTLKITNCKQFERLVQLMEKNISVARGYMSFGSSKEEFTKIWNGFSDQLNSLGPPVRTIPEWQKVWNDYKAKVKGKLGHNKKEIKTIGGGYNKLLTFSAQEESVIDILMLREVSKSSRRTFGLGTTNTYKVMENTETISSDPIHFDSPDYSTAELEYIYEDQSVEAELPPEPKVSKLKRSGSIKAKDGHQEERNLLLKEQTASIKETERHTKEMVRYTRKIYEIKAKKLKLLEEDLLEKRKFRKNNLEFKLREIKYKERKLALLESRSSANMEY